MYNVERGVMQVLQVFLWPCSKVAVTLDACSDDCLLGHPKWKEDVVTLQTKKQNKTYVSGYSRYGMLLRRLDCSG
jgi:hypothetical protein